MPCTQTNDVECVICHKMMAWDENYVRVPYQLAPPIGGTAHEACADRARAGWERRCQTETHQRSFAFSRENANDPERTEPPHVLLGVTGSVAAGLTPTLASALSQHTAGLIDIVATRMSFHFWNPADLPFPSRSPSPDARAGAGQREGEKEIKVWRDEDEWPATGYVRGQDIPHIQLREWADILVIAPVSANTLAKLAAGMADNLLTSVVRAWRRDRPIVLAPAMNTQMWEHPATAEHLATLSRWFPKLVVVEPQVKTLACGEIGIGAMAQIDTIGTTVEALLEDAQRDPAEPSGDWCERIHARAAAIHAEREWFAEHGGC